MLYDPVKFKMPEVMPQTVSGVLERAADYMERHGHCTSTFEDAEGRVCLVGAISRVAAGNISLTDGAIGALWDAMGGGIAQFNETHTKEQNIAKLREAARSLMTD